ncbi:MAG TPA: Holliday junction resolvase RuvX [Sedimentisphaerales bacterium]|nr:Holliday junction resolvase RuvX [Sedimentisphaerales bacterium]
MRYLAIDYGMKRTGLAICDKAEMLSSPLEVLATNSELIGKISKIVTDESVDAVVLGMPINMDDSRGGQAKIVENFAKQLQQQIKVEIIFQDERLSSYGAEDKLAAADYTRKKKKKRLDAVAAAEILETFLESKRML